MKLYLFPASSRVLGILALKNHLGVDCQLEPINLGAGDQTQPRYLALNPNSKMPTLVDGDYVLWEANAILFYFASRHPGSGLWPSDLKDQASVLRWLAWESAHWDAESIGMVSYEKSSKAVLGYGPPDPVFIARGERNFSRFAAVLNQSLVGKPWIAGKQLTIADFSIGGLVPSAERMGLPVSEFPEVVRWYKELSALQAWRDALAYRDAALARWLASKTVT
jgi:glutathione S-transferase